MKTERRIQQEIFTAHWNRYREERGLLIYIHNNPKDAIEGAILRSIGMIKGVADMLYMKPGGPNVFLEVKGPGGRQQPEQKEFERTVKKWGHEYHIVTSYEEAAAVCGWPF